MFLYPKEWVDEEDKELAKTVSDWGEKEVIPDRQDFDEDYDNRIIKPAMDKLFVDIGLQKMIWPEEFGGAGISSRKVAITLTRVLEEVGKASAGIGFVLSNTITPFVPILLGGNYEDESFNEFGEIFCKTNEAKVCSLILPDYGDLDGRVKDDFLGRTIHVSAEPKDGKYIIYGEEIRPVNSGNMADLFCAACRSGNGLGFLILKKEDIEEEITVGRPIKKTGLAADENAIVSFGDVTVSEKYMICEGVEAEKYLKELISWNSLCLSAVCVGAMMDANETFKEWGGERVIKYNQILKENPMIAGVLSEIANKVLSSRILVYNLARALAKPEIYGDTDKLFATSKAISSFITDSAVEVLNRGMEVMGSQGYAREGDVEKHFRDIRIIKASTGGEPANKMDVSRWFYESENL